MAPKQPSTATDDVANTAPGSRSSAKPELAGPAVEAASADGANTVQRAALGIQVTETDDVIPGLTVAGFSEGTRPADTGLQVGDLIFALDGVPTPTIADVARMLLDRQPGDEVTLRVVRDRKSTSVTMNLRGKTVASEKPVVDPESIPGPALPDSIASEQLPMNLASPAKADPPKLPTPTVAVAAATSPDAIGITIRDAKGVRGPMVEAVDDQSPAAAAGLKAGDRIVSLDGRLMVDAATFNRELKLRKATATLPLQLVRDGKLIAADVPLTNRGALANSNQSGRGSVAGEDKSVFGGIGSMLGGLLGGKSNNAPQPKVKSLQDEMALEDEPVQQAAFESELKKGKKSDPPSLNALELPPDDASPIRLDSETDANSGVEDDPEALRAEIRRLQERLKAAESKE